jgi:hypothetical protein
MTRIFKERSFARWMRKTELTDALLVEAVREMARGLINADLGGGVLKKRIALPGRGKSGGARTILVTNKDTRWIFLFGYEKNEKDSLTHEELDATKKYATAALGWTQEQIAEKIHRQTLEEIHHEKETSTQVPPVGGHP